MIKGIYKALSKKVNGVTIKISFRNNRSYEEKHYVRTSKATAKTILWV